MLKQKIPIASFFTMTCRHSPVTARYHFAIDQLAGKLYPTEKKQDLHVPSQYNTALVHE